MLVHVVVEFVIELGFNSIGTRTACGAVRIHIARTDLYLRGVVACFALKIAHFRHGQDSDVLVRIHTALVDFQTTCREAQFREVFVELGNPAANEWSFFNQDYLLADFSSFERSSHAADATANNQNRLIGCNYIRHLFPPKGRASFENTSLINVIDQHRDSFFMRQKSSPCAGRHTIPVSGYFLHIPGVWL